MDRLNYFHITRFRFQLLWLQICPQPCLSRSDLTLALRVNDAIDQDASASKARRFSLRYSCLS